MIDPAPSDFPEVDPAADPGFDLKRGLVALVIVITLMVVITLICLALADQ